MSSGHKACYRNLQREQVVVREGREEKMGKIPREEDQTKNKKMIMIIMIRRRKE